VRNRTKIGHALILDWLMKWLMTFLSRFENGDILKIQYDDS